jgi:hypothetical protein
MVAHRKLLKIERFTGVSEWHKIALLSAVRETGENGKQFGSFDPFMRDTKHGTKFATQASK